MGSGIKTICFYSFKGGAGRTVCTANVARFLAKELGATKKRPVLLLDLDLDSAGLTILLGQGSTFEGSKWSMYGILKGDLALDVDPVREDFFSTRVVDVSAELGADSGTVLFVGSEVVGASDIAIADGDSLDRMDDLVARSEEHGIGTIIIDSASGWQQAARLSHFTSDLVVYCCRMTHQFIEGTKLQLERFVELCEQERGRVPKIIILPVAVPPSTPTWEERKALAIGSLKALRSKLKDRTTVEMADSFVDEVVSFKWYESVLAKKAQLEQDEQVAQSAFESLAKQIHRLLST
jgi:cellulose biosynthesis protein BcsQ